MAIELKIPEAGESVQEVQIARWLKQEGDQVEEDENLVELETDKASMELPAPAAGVISQILKHDGDMVNVGDTIAYIEQNGQTEQAGNSGDDTESPTETAEMDTGEAEDEKAEPKKKSTAKGEEEKGEKKKGKEKREGDADEEPKEEKTREPESVPVTPSARRALREHGLTADQVEPAGERLRPEDVKRYVEQHEGEKNEQDGEDSDDAELKESEELKDKRDEAAADDSPLEETVPMSLIRRRIAERLVEAQQNAALLTTFNEIEMSRVIALRDEFGERFDEQYGIKLGFMSFFVKAAVDALKQFPEINAEIRGTDIVYRNYFHVGIAIGSDKGLVVPVLRHAERMSFAEIEQAIDDFASRAQHNKLKPDELEGGTFTISNGGIYGSLLSTPIVNPPQSGVLGMHAIEDRPVARGGEVVVRPMMYVALTYDHRIVDGREAVSFLRRIKEAVERPPRMLLEV